jgi:hypothetical protein
MKYLFYPIEKASKMRTGQCYIDHYWLVHPTKGLAFYSQSGALSKQCNSDKRIVEYIKKNNKDLKDFDIVLMNAFFGNDSDSSMRKHLVE